MRIEGYLLKRRPKLKSWRRKYFVLQGTELSYYANEHYARSRTKVKGLSRVIGVQDWDRSIADSPRASLNNLLQGVSYPRQHRFIIRTRHPNQSMLFVMAESQDDKQAWMDAIRTAVVRHVPRKDNLLSVNISTLREFPCRAHLSSKALISAGSHSKHVALIALFVGDMQTVTLMSSVSTEWREAVHMKRNRYLWKFLVRYGGISSFLRWRLWWTFLNLPYDPDMNITREMQDLKALVAKSVTEDEVWKDVRRTFGVVPHKRMGRRRSLSINFVFPQMRNARSHMHHSASMGIDHRQRSSGADEDDDEDDLVERTSNVFDPPLSEEDLKHKQKHLASILCALAGAFPSVGYCQGMDCVVVHLMRACRCASSLESLIGDEASRRDEIDTQREGLVFTLMQHMVESLGALDMYDANGTYGLLTQVKNFETLLNIYLPSLTAHMEEHSVTVEMFCVGWLQTFFLYMEALSAKAIDRIWDVLLFEKDFKIIHKVALAVMKISQRDLMSLDFEGIITFFNVLPNASVYDADVLLPTAWDIKITGRMLRSLTTAQSSR